MQARPVEFWARVIVELVAYPQEKGGKALDDDINSR